MQNEPTFKTNPAFKNEQEITNHHAQAIELMLSKEMFIPSLFKAITPKSFNKHPQYIEKGYVHPSKVLVRRRLEYLKGLSFILGSDQSVPPEMFKTAMEFVNSLFSYPLEHRKLIAHVMVPVLTGKKKINGRQLWRYNSNWKAAGFSFITKIGEPVDVFFDDIKNLYFLINFSTKTVVTYKSEYEVFKYMRCIGASLPKKEALSSLVPLVRTFCDPKRQFGFYSDDGFIRKFNTFSMPARLEIINNPKNYKGQYKKPIITLMFLNHLIPCNKTRRYVLQFLRKKFTTFHYSPTILSFMGERGSGKDTFIRLISLIIGQNYIARPELKDFINPLNEWLIDKHFVQLKDYNDQSNNDAFLQKAQWKVKDYSGKEQIQIIKQDKTSYDYNHKATFIMTATDNPLQLQGNEKNVFMIQSPDSMSDSRWVARKGGLKAVHEALSNEIDDFCYYLATKVNDMSLDNYMQNVITDAHRKSIAKTLPADKFIVYCFLYELFDELLDVATKHEMADILDNINNNMILKSTLSNLYAKITGKQPHKNSLLNDMKEAGFKLIRSYNDNKFYYVIPTLENYRPAEQAGK